MDTTILQKMNDDKKLAEFLAFHGYKSTQEMRESCKKQLADCEVRIKKLGNFFNEVYEDEFHYIWKYQCAIEKALKELEELLKSEI